jgi:hypothetical protein
MARSAGIVLAVALTVRILLHLPVFSDPSRAESGDSYGYVHTADSIRAHGHHLVSTHRPPGYPYLLALLRTLFGTGLLVPFLMNLLADSASAGLVVLLAARAGLPGGLPRAAGLAYALSPVAAFWSGTVMTESLFTLAVLSAALLWLHPGRRSTLGAGLLLGAAVLLRDLASLLAAVLLVVELLQKRPPRWDRLGLAAAGAAALTLPFVILHGVKLGTWTTATTHRGSLVGYEAPGVLSLEAGRTLGGFLYEDDFLDDGKRELLRRSGNEAAGGDVLWWMKAQDARTRDAAWSAVLSAPHRAALLHAAGALKSLGSGDLGRLTQERPAPVRAAALGLLLPLQIAMLGLGLASVFRPAPEEGFLAAAAVAVFLLAPGPASESRFLVPALPFLAVAAARTFGRLFPSGARP